MQVRPQRHRKPARAVPTSASTLSSSSLIPHELGGTLVEHEAQRESLSLCRRVLGVAEPAPILYRGRARLYAPPHLARRMHAGERYSTDNVTGRGTMMPLHCLLMARWVVRGPERLIWVLPSDLETVVPCTSTLDSKRKALRGGGRGCEGMN